MHNSHVHNAVPRICVKQRQHSLHMCRYTTLIVRSAMQGHICCRLTGLVSICCLQLVGFKAHAWNARPSDLSDEEMSWLALQVCHRVCPMQLLRLAHRLVAHPCFAVCLSICQYVCVHAVSCSHSYKCPDPLCLLVCVLHHVGLHCKILKRLTWFQPCYVKLNHPQCAVNTASGVFPAKEITETPMLTVS